MKKTLAIIISMILILAITLPAAAISTIAVKSIQLDNNKVNLKVGETTNLNVVFTPANTSQTTLKYATNNINVATISSTGEIKAIHEGNTIITVLTLNKKIFAKCNVTVSSDKSKIDITKSVDILFYAVGVKPNDSQKVLDKASISIKRQTNATLHVEYISLADFPTKYPLVLSSGEDVDLLSVAPWLNFSQNVARGAFIEFTDKLLKTCMPMTYKNEAPEAWKQVKINGKIYANIYTTNKIIVIEPLNGKILSIIDGSEIEAAGRGIGEVMNGIAVNNGKIYMTGKNWEKLFEVKIDKIDQ